jgi:hypothetical protein
MAGGKLYAPTIIIIIISELILFIYFNCKWVFTLWQWYYSKSQYTNKTPRSNKHIIQNYTNNKGHTTHNEYNANSIITTTNTVATTVI